MRTGQVEAHEITRLFLNVNCLIIWLSIGRRDLIPPLAYIRVGVTWADETRHSGFRAPHKDKTFIWLPC